MPLSNIQKKCCSFKTTNPEKTKSGDPDFDVPMGCYDVAEACELVGIFILTKLSNIRDKRSIGLYRDDRLAYFRNYLGHK